MQTTAARFSGLFFIFFTDFALKNTLKLKLNQFCFYRLKIHHITGPLAYQTSTSFTVIVFFRIFAFGYLELFSFCSKYTPFFSDFAAKNTLKLKITHFLFNRLKIHLITGLLPYQMSTTFKVI